MEGGFRKLYGPSGPESYYQVHGDAYHNPHADAVVACIDHVVAHWTLPLRTDGVDLRNVLDLAAGGGEATLALRRLCPTSSITGIDPFTAALYQRRTGQPCQELTFEQIASAEVTLPGFTCIVVSCALHLAADSWLPALCLALAAVAPDLIVLTPLTRPQLREQWGWRLIEADSCTVDGHTLRLRWYRSRLLSSNQGG